MYHLLYNSETNGKFRWRRMGRLVCSAEIAALFRFVSDQSNHSHGRNRTEHSRARRLGQTRHIAGKIPRCRAGTERAESRGQRRKINSWVRSIDWWSRSVHGEHQQQGPVNWPGHFGTAGQKDHYGSPTQRSWP